jgi:glutamyl-tRNA reductase
VTRPADQIVAHVVHARAVPATARERFAASFRGQPSGNGLLLETCHRVEFYAADSAAGARDPDPGALPEGGAILRGELAVRHALSVAVGRDSVVVGEDQVLHQLRQALGAAQARGALDPVLQRLFALALRAGRRARSWRQAPSLSLADVAVARLQRGATGIAGRDVLVVGGGEMGRLVAHAAHSAGASVSVSSRSVDRAASVVQRLGGRVEDLDPRARIRGYVGIVVALGGPWALEPETIDALAEGTAVVVDLSVPAAVPEHLAERLGRRLTTADDLAHDEPRSSPASRPMLARLDALVDQSTEEFLAWLDGRDRRAAASALVERADVEREAELAELWRRLPDLDPEARATIEGMSRHLAERLLRQPLERLGADTDGRHERAVRELWAL